MGHGPKSTHQTWLWGLGTSLTLCLVLGCIVQATEKYSSAAPSLCWPMLVPMYFSAPSQYRHPFWGRRGPWSPLLPTFFFPKVGSHSLWKIDCLHPAVSRQLWLSLLWGSRGLLLEPLSQVGKYEHLGFQYLLWPRVPSLSALWWDGPFPPTGGMT